MAFVLVQHLAPDHKSILAELVRRYTRMDVHEVVDGIVVRPNCAYIIPPNRDMAFLNGTLQLLDPAMPRGQRMPIDFFFRSLAQDQGERAIGIVLSGTGSDGTLGVRAIKGEGGMVMAQTPESTEFDGMPRSAIATGLVDYELPASEMPERLIQYATHAFGRFVADGTLPSPKVESSIRKVFILLRNQTGHDFSQYKVNMIHRRIERRMAVHQIALIEDYVRYLQQTPPEVEALFRDLLIGVTSFFRDTEVYATLAAEVIPAIFAGKPSGSVVRVWVAGCSTGEEAYSLAMLLLEHMETAKPDATLQIFATDIDSRAIATARAGVYPSSIAADVSPERLSRFFVAEPAGSEYRVQKFVRDTLVFSEQDVIKDPPFSRLDLICCRNLLIYLGGDLQKKLMSLFHYALNRGGVLCLGTSETVGDAEVLFGVIDRPSRLYRRLDDVVAIPRTAWGRFPSVVPIQRAAQWSGASRPSTLPKVSIREQAERALLQQLAPASALVNGAGDILYLHGRTGLYLEPAPGETGVNNIVKMAREGLRHELVNALHHAATSKGAARTPGLRIRTNGHYTTVNLSVLPVEAAPESEGPLFLVILEDAPQATVAETAHAAPNIAAEVDARILSLQQELRAKEEYLQVANEELETSNEELKSSNEELQSVNEELQSTNEELETAKEEMQSINEELATVNNELQFKLTDLGRSNNDMNNLLAGTGVATVFVDFQLRIMRFTPSAATIINLIPADVGRPVSHIVSKLVGYDHLFLDTQAVLDTLVPKEELVATSEGRWFKLHIQPYRTLENVIEGAVISFLDVTDLVQTRERLRKANDLARLAVVVRDASDAITVQDLTGRIIAWNPAATLLYGWSEAEALTLNVSERIPEEQRAGAMDKLSQLSQEKVLQPYLAQRRTKQGSLIEVSVTSTALVDEAGRIYAIATSERALVAGKASQ